MESNESSAPDERVGEIVDERYLLTEHIADGGMASVYRAEHMRTNEPFAVKILHREFADNDEIVARFRSEIQACRKVQHAHVVAATDFGRLDDGCSYMVLEYTAGDDLSVVLQRDEPFDQARAVKIALQVALALIAAHAAGVVHRDLKPDNIMLIERDGDPDYVKVVDFGIAKMPRRGQPLTALGSVFGTPEYMAPEQARGAQVDHRTDLYTLGIVLYEMLTGATPFASDNISGVIMAQITQAPEPLPTHVDPELRELIHRLLAKDPAARPQTAVEITSQLLGILRRLAPSHPVLSSAPVARFATTAAALPAASRPVAAPAPPASAAPAPPASAAPAPPAMPPASAAPAPPASAAPAPPAMPPASAAEAPPAMPPASAPVPSAGVPVTADLAPLPPSSAPAPSAGAARAPSAGVPVTADLAPLPPSSAPAPSAGAARAPSAGVPVTADLAPLPPSSAPVPSSAMPSAVAPTGVQPIASGPKTSTGCIVGVVALLLFGTVVAVLATLILRLFL